MEAGRRAVRTSPAPPQRAGRAGRQRDRGSEPSVTRSPPSSVGSRTGTARCSTHHHSPPTCAGHRSSSSSSPRREGKGGSIVTALPPAGAGRGARLQGQSVHAGPGLQGECGSGGGREATAPAAAGGPIPGDEGAAEAESGRGSQRLSLLPSSLGRRNQSRGQGWEGSGARAGAGAGRLLGWQLRQSGGGTLGRELGAPGRQAQRREGRERGSGAGPRARGCPTRLPRPLTTPLAEWEPPAVAGVGGKEGGETGWNGVRGGGRRGAEEWGTGWKGDV